MTVETQAAGGGAIGAGDILGSTLALLDAGFTSLGEAEALVGVIAAFLSGLAIFVVVGIQQNRRSATFLRRYRFAEPYLIRARKITVESMVQYHSAYNWGNYAAIALSSAFVVGALQFGDSSIREDSELLLVSIVSCTGLSIAGAIMAAVDLVNTNTLSPLVPVTSRFRIIDKCIVLGGLGVTMAICSVIAFLSMVEPILSIIGGIVFFIVMTYLSSIRALPRDELMRYFSLNENEWIELNRKIEESSVSGVEPVACEPPPTFRARLAANRTPPRRKVRND